MKRPTTKRLMGRQSMMRLKRMLLPAVLLGAGLILETQNVDAMPMFARKFGVGCETCHTTIPALNETGYKFRAKGFRMPATIGKEEEKKFDLGDALSGRLQFRYDTQVTNQPNGAPIPNCPGGVCGARTTTNAFSFQEATLYPLTGSWGKYFAAESELSVSPEDFFEIENAYIRFVKGDDTRFFTARAGIFHSWEGFGASDRPYSNARTLFQTSPISASGRAIPYLFQPWGLDTPGVEVGADINDLSLRAAVLSGTFMRWDEEANAFLAFPAQTGPWKGANQAVGALGKPADSIGHNSPDFSTNVTYLLHQDGGGVSLIYYHGHVATPTQCTSGTPIGQKSATTGEVCGVSANGEVGTTDFDFSSATAFENAFDRVAVYASYPLGKFLPMGGFEYGRDETPVNAATFPASSALQTFNSKGAFADGVFFLHRYLTAGIRYDQFHPNTGKLNTQWAITPYVNIPFYNGLQIIAEYQHRDFQLDASHNRQNDTFQVRVIFIQ
ncbi:MAG: hypothetical protein HY047_08460 [Acidobacteria bacterium]|nr:hypothetical protein [Acidobacteriota bacterium]